VSELLESIELQPGPSAALTPRRSARWLWILAVAAIGLFFLVVPVRLSLARSEVLRLEAQWHAARAIDSGRLAVAAALAAQASPTDGESVAAASHAADEEAVVALQRLSSAVRRDIVVDLEVLHLRQAVTNATGLYSTQVALGDLGGFERLDRIRAFQEAAQEADKLLAGELRRFGLRPTPDPPPAHLVSTDRALASLGRIVDQPSSDRLVVSSPAGLEMVDLNRNTVTRIRLSGLPQVPVDRIVPRKGWVAVILAVGKGVEQLYAAPPSLTGAVRPLGLLANVAVVLGGSRPDTVWVELPDARVEEVGSGGAVTGPVKLPRDRRLVSVVDAGLVLADTGSQQPAVTVWDPQHDKVVRSIGPPALFVSGAGHDTVAWVTASNALRFTTVSTAAVTNVGTPTGGLPGGSVGALSPDGRYFASTLIESPTGRTIPAVVDIQTGTVVEPLRSPGELFDTGGFVWSATGDTLYLNASRGGDGGHDAMVWPIPDGEPAYLRLGGGSVAVLAAA